MYFHKMYVNVVIQQGGADMQYNIDSARLAFNRYYNKNTKSEIGAMRAKMGDIMWSKRGSKPHKVLQLEPDYYTISKIVNGGETKNNEILYKIKLNNINKSYKKDSNIYIKGQNTGCVLAENVNRGDESIVVKGEFDSDQSGKLGILDIKNNRYFKKGGVNRYNMLGVDEFDKDKYILLEGAKPNSYIEVKTKGEPVIRNSKIAPNSPKYKDHFKSKFNREIGQNRELWRKSYGVENIRNPIDIRWVKYRNRKSVGFIIANYPKGNHSIANDMRWWDRVFGDSRRTHKKIPISIFLETINKELFTNERVEIIQNMNVNILKILGNCNHAELEMEDTCKIKEYKAGNRDTQPSINRKIFQELVERFGSLDVLKDNIINMDDGTKVQFVNRNISEGINDRSLPKLSSNGSVQPVESTIQLGDLLGP